MIPNAKYAFLGSGNTMLLDLSKYMAAILNYNPVFREKAIN